jgi:hypothetical protein
MGQTKRDRKIMACRSEMPGQNCQYMIASIGLPGQDCQDRTARIRLPGLSIILALILALTQNLKGL